MLKSEEHWGFQKKWGYLYYGFLLYNSDNNWLYVEIVLTSSASQGVRLSQFCLWILFFVVSSLLMLAYVFENKAVLLGCAITAQSVFKLCFISVLPVLRGVINKVIHSFCG